MLFNDNFEDNAALRLSPLSSKFESSDKKENKVKLPKFKSTKESEEIEELLAEDKKSRKSN